MGFEVMRLVWFGLRVMGGVVVGLEVDRFRLMWRIYVGGWR